MRKFRFLLGLICVIAGLIIFAQPTIQEWKIKTESEEVANSIDTEKANLEDSDSEVISTVRRIALEQMYEQMQLYNANIYESGQNGLKDVFSYEEVGGVLDDYWDTDEAVGYITIPKMDVKLPLYLGASLDHLSQGAAVLGQTSMPVGGLNTNCVIAGHRGYQGAPFFREIELLEKGDKVVLTTLWGTLTYQVSKILIVNPTDLSGIKIQEGQDMVTLLTCHPYRSGGKYRYLVQCTRTLNDSDTETDGTSEKVLGDGVIWESSQEEIHWELALRQIAVIVFLILAVALFIRYFVKKKGGKRCYGKDEFPAE